MPEMARAASRTICGRTSRCSTTSRARIGERYRRQDEVGTPFCITVDGESTQDGTVTVRDRDTLQAGPHRRRRAVAAIIGGAPRADERRRCRSSASARDGEAFMEELSREYYLAHAGHKASAELQPIYAKHATILGPRRARADARGVSRQRRREARSDARRGCCSTGRSESQSARELARARRARDRVGGRRRRSARRRTRDSVSAHGDRDGEQHRPRRARDDRAGAQRAGAARARADEARAVPARARHHRVARARADGYNATFELLSGVSLAGLRDECEQFLRDTQAMWDEVCPEFVKRVLGMTPSEATRADALALFRAREFDEYFPAADMEPSIRRQVREMGIDPEAGGPHALRHRRARGEALARVLRAGARARRGVSRAAPARRPDRLARPSCTSWGTRCTSRTCAPTIRSSTAGWATTRSPKGTRCCSTT